MPSTFEELREKISEFESAHDSKSILEFIVSQKLDGNSLINFAIYLYFTGYYFSSYILSQTILNKGFKHYILLFILSNLGYKYSDRKTARSTEDLFCRDYVQLPEPEKQAFISEFEDALIRDVLEAFSSGQYDYLKEISRLHQRIFPKLANILSDQRTEMDTSDSSNKLMDFSTPGSFTRSPEKTIIILYRKRYFPTKEARLHELGPRFTRAFLSYGWSCRFYDVETGPDNDLTESLARFWKDSEASPPDAIYFDPTLPFEDNSGLSFLNEVKQRYPDCRCVGLFNDLWHEAERDKFFRVSRILDFFWNWEPSNELFENEILRRKCLFNPTPYGIEFEPDISPFNGKLGFVGSVNSLNWQRGLWFGALRSQKVPVEFDHSDHSDDSLDPLVSYARYLQRISRFPASLNFAIRSNWKRAYTGRALEVPLTGALLVQEYAEDCGRYLIPGEHYFSFRTLGDLLDIHKIITNDPEHAEAVRRRGCDFVRSTYADDKLISYMDWRIFQDG